MAYGRNQGNNYRGKRPSKSYNNRGNDDFCTFLGESEDQEGVYFKEYKHGNKVQAKFNDQDDLMFKVNDEKTQILEMQQGDYGPYWRGTMWGVSVFITEGESDKGPYLKVKAKEMPDFPIPEKDEDEAPRSSRGRRGGRGRQEEADQEEDEAPKRTRRGSGKPSGRAASAKAVDRGAKELDKATKDIVKRNSKKAESEDLDDLPF